MNIRVQDLYDVVVSGKKVHRGTLRDTAQSVADARLYSPLERITFSYTDANGEEQTVSATDTSVHVMRMKILVVFIQSQRYDYSRSSREQLKDKLGLSTVSCSNYMPEIINGKLRDWTVDDLSSAIAAFKKDEG